ncbi:unnamed protein product [Strongylus vulgaris]|uniref:Uncharacterized protein n=1 Tax=Strongylus vulgaris TaxID=40348 RepID=A0A3P7L4T6_STRVU|nr:unnamed protein product [Strongylus vulgaris]
MIPDVIYKVSISFCSLFFAIQEADAGLKGSISRLMFVLTAVMLQFFENYVLCMSLSAMHLEEQQLIQHRPPPTYEQLSVAGLMQQRPSTSKPVVPEQINKAARPETPPPCYENAVENLKAAKADVHIV